MHTRTIVENAANALAVDIKTLFERAYVEWHGHDVPVVVECSIESYYEQTKNPFKHDPILPSWLTQYCHRVLHDHTGVRQ